MFKINKTGLTGHDMTGLNMNMTGLTGPLLPSLLMPKQLYPQLLPLLLLALPVSMARHFRYPNDLHLAWHSAQPVGSHQSRLAITAYHWKPHTGGRQRACGAGAGRSTGAPFQVSVRSVSPRSVSPSAGDCLQSDGDPVDTPAEPADGRRRSPAADQARRLAVPGD